MKFCFIDSDIIICANDCSDSHKQERAIEITKLLMGTQSGVISTQVMQEYANVALTKMGQESSVVLRQLKLLEDLILTPLQPKRPEGRSN